MHLMEEEFAHVAAKPHSSHQAITAATQKTLCDHLHFLKACAVLHHIIVPGTLQELLLRRCVAALHSWHRIACFES